MEQKDWMSSGRYLMLEPAEQLVPCNAPYGLGDSGPGLIAFGSDGGGTMLYAFDVRGFPYFYREGGRDLYGPWSHYALWWHLR